MVQNMKDNIKMEKKMVKEYSKLEANNQGTAKKNKLYKGS